jgi:alpha-mannosidase
MLPPNPLLQLVPSRVLAAVERVQALVWRPIVQLRAEASRASPAYRPLAAARRERRSPLRGPHHWGKLFDQRWVRVEVPRSRPAGSLFLEWRDQGEATLYVDGVPHYGFDVAHRYCPLPHGAREVWLECLCVRSAIWHPDASAGLDREGSRCEGAWLVACDEQAWRVYHDLNVLADLMTEERKAHFPTQHTFDRFRHQTPVEHVSVLYRRLLRLLDEAVDALDTGGLDALENKLRFIYRELRSDPLALDAVLTGHAHIDLVWLWPERVGEAKAVHSFATADRLMDLYPEFRFAYSQTASYAAVARRAPELHRRVMHRIREKEWEATGAMEVESDTMLPCGEALARSLLLGQEAFAKLRGGKPSPLLWLPDVFGYSGCLPQLMRQCGVDYFFTTKMTWGAITKFPHSSFVWRGDDGSEVVAHVVSQSVGYNGKTSVAELKGHALGHRQSDIHREFLAPTGWGDGGGGPTEEMCERARRMANLASLPRVKWGGVEPFFERLAKLRAKLPTYQGECYLEYHRGVFTTHGEVKAAFRGLERALQIQEAAACATGAGPIDAHAWRRLVFAQFHDYIPGSSVPDVYREGVAEHRRLAAAAESAAAMSLSRTNGVPCLFNPTPHPRTEFVRTGRSTRMVHLPPLTGLPLSECSRERPRVEPARAVGRSLQNGIVSARFGADGWIENLLIDGHAVQLMVGAGALWVYPDRPALFDAWDIDRQTLALGRRLGRPASLQTRNTADGAAMVVTHLVGKKSRVTIRFTLRPGERGLRVDISADWHEPHTLVKMIFPTRYAGRTARFGAPFGSVQRSQQPGRPQDEAMWEVPGSRWAAVTDEGEHDGLFVVTEAKYGFSARDGALGVSLLRTVPVTGFDQKHAAAYPHSLLREPNAPRLADLGRHEIKLALGRYDTWAPREQHPAALADTLFTPLVPYHGRAVDCGLRGLSGALSLQPCWAKPLGRGRWLVRLHETLGRRGAVQLDLAPGWTACRSDLREGPGVALDRGRIPFHPYEIVSVIVSRGRRTSLPARRASRRHTG